MSIPISDMAPNVLKIISVIDYTHGHWHLALGLLKGEKTDYIN